ncbi:MAG: hypothetical protein IMX00_03445 [Limnochordales bacterium]|nr:hypothetical protein [Limnochordales bacterium]
MQKPGVAGFPWRVLLAIGAGVWASLLPATAGAKASALPAVSALPPLPGAVAAGPTRLYTDAELGFELLLPGHWQVVAHESGSAGAGGEAAWCEFRPSGAGTGASLWIRVIRIPLQLDSATGKLAAEEQNALASWLSGSYYAWRWLVDLRTADTRLPGSDGPAAAGSRPVAYASGEGMDSTGARVQLHLWVFAGPGEKESAQPTAAPGYLVIAGGPSREVEAELGLFKAIVATFRPLAATVPGAVTHDARANPADDLLAPLELPEVQLALKQPRGWEAYAGRQGVESLVQLAAADGKALILIHLIDYSSLSLSEESTDTEAVELLGRAYLAILTVPAEQGGEGLAAIDVKAAGLTGADPARFEAIFTYEDPQVGPAAGWLLVQLVTPAAPGAARHLLVLEARSVADRFDILYPTFQAVSASIRLLPQASNP